MPTGHPRVFFGEMSVKVFFDWVVGFLLSCMGCLYILEIKPLSVPSLSHHLQTFSSIPYTVFLAFEGFLCDFLCLRQENPLEVAHHVMLRVAPVSLGVRIWG